MNLKQAGVAFKRMWLPILAAGMILVPDAGSNVVLYALGITLAVSAVSHLVRKILFPYIDMSEYASRALETPVGASVIFASISMILSVIILSTCMLLK